MSATTPATKADLTTLELAMKTELQQFATKADLERFATKTDLVRFATKADLERFATKADLERFATKADLEQFATKTDLVRFATKTDLAELERATNAGFWRLEQAMTEGLKRMHDDIDLVLKVMVNVDKKHQERGDVFERRIGSLEKALAA